MGELAPSPQDDSLSQAVGVPELDPRPYTIDQLVRTRVVISGDSPILAYPSSGIKYVDYTPRQLDIYAFNAALHYASDGVPRRTSSDEKPHVVALLGFSNVDYVVSMLALSKLGCTVMFLSLRISEEAHRSLLEKTGSRDVVVHESFGELAATLQKTVPGLRVHSIAGPDVYDNPLSKDTIDTRLDHTLDPLKENKHTAWVIHSSGSTSLPKPVYQSHAAILSNYRFNNIPHKGFITMPLYHSHGTSTMMKAMYSGKQVHLYNADLPLAAKYLIGTMNKYQFDAFHCVPYALKLLSEHEEAVELLGKMKIVVFAGSSCPDELGDALTKRGVCLVSNYGTTETGNLMTSERPPEDKDWNWVRPTAKTAPFVKFEDRGAGLLEIICLPGWPGKVMTNRDDGSYATRDLFVKHPTRQAYKYFSRLDDTLTLVNGEKANPLLIEGLVRQNADVKEVVAYGAGRTQLGLLLFPTPEGAELSRAELLRRIEPSLERAHAEIPEYAHVLPNMIKIMASNATYRTTDKGTIIRQAVYKQYAADIDSMYSEDDANQGELDISGDELQHFLGDEVRKLLSLEEGVVMPDTDFFKLGMDSLRATQLRSSILSQIYLNGGKLGLNIAFDYPSVRALATKLEAVRNGSTEDGMEGGIDVDLEMEQLIARFGSFDDIRRAGQSIVLTGATGSLGAHIASILALREDVDKIYCLVRAKSPDQALERVLKSLSDRKVLSLLSEAQLAKIIALPSDLSKPNLSLDDTTMQELLDNVTAAIHSAWSVNFNLRLSSFTDDCLVAARSLIDLCIRSKRQASYNFCSSVSTMANYSNGAIPEEVPAKTSYAQGIGYAQSKLVAERMCMAAAETAGIQARVLRIGQISGDTVHGVWNDTEAFPLIFRTAMTTGTLPRIDETPRWLPLDIVAKTVVDLSVSPAVPSNVYNVINPRTFHWTKDLLPLLREAGLTFEEVSPAEWVGNVRNSDPDPAKNPPYKLVEFFAQRYGGAGVENEEGKQNVPVGWCTAKTEAHSGSFRNVPVIDVEYVKRMLQYWKENCW